MTTYNVPFSDLGRYKAPRVVTPPAAEILDAVRRGQTYGELAAVYGVSESTLRRRVQDSRLVARRHGRLPVVPLVSQDYPEWMDEGLCSQVDPELFFPETGCSPRLARKVCAECPVRTQCLAWALERDERFGVWAGTTPKQRQQMLKDRS